MHLKIKDVFQNKYSDKEEKKSRIGSIHEKISPVSFRIKNKVFVLFFAVYKK